MLDEQVLRRPDFREGVPIKLSDGQEWVFPKPRVGVMPEVNTEGKVVFPDKLKRNFGPAYEALIDQYIEAEEGVDILSAKLAIAVDLLGRNYTLQPQDFSELLQYWSEDKDNEEMWQAITNVGMGRSPKASPVG